MESQWGIIHELALEMTKYQIQLKTTFAQNNLKSQIL